MMDADDSVFAPRSPQHSPAAAIKTQPNWNVPASGSGSDASTAAAPAPAPAPVKAVVMSVNGSRSVLKQPAPQSLPSPRSVSFKHFDTTIDTSNGAGSARRVVSAGGGSGSSVRADFEIGKQHSPLSPPVSADSGSASAGHVMDASPVLPLSAKEREQQQRRRGTDPGGVARRKPVINLSSSIASPPGVGIITTTTTTSGSPSQYSPRTSSLLLASLAAAGNASPSKGGSSPNRPAWMSAGPPGPPGSGSPIHNNILLDDTRNVIGGGGGGGSANASPNPSPHHAGSGSGTAASLSSSPSLSPRDRTGAGAQSSTPNSASLSAIAAAAAASRRKSLPPPSSSLLCPIPEQRPIVDATEMAARLRTHRTQQNELIAIAAAAQRSVVIGTAVGSSPLAAAAASTVPGYSSSIALGSPRKQPSPPRNSGGGANGDGTAANGNRSSPPSPTTASGVVLGASASASSALTSLGRGLGLSLDDDDERTPADGDDDDDDDDDDEDGADGTDSLVVSEPGAGDDDRRRTPAQRRAGGGEGSAGGSGSSSSGARRPHVPPLRLSSGLAVVAAVGAAAVSIVAGSGAGRSSPPKDTPNGNAPARGSLAKDSARLPPRHSAPSTVIVHRATVVSGSKPTNRRRTAPSGTAVASSSTGTAATATGAGGPAPSYSSLLSPRGGSAGGNAFKSQSGRLVAGNHQLNTTNTSFVRMIPASLPPHPHAHAGASNHHSPSLLSRMASGVYARFTFLLGLLTLMPLRLFIVCPLLFFFLVITKVLSFKRLGLTPRLRKDAVRLITQLVCRALHLVLGLQSSTSSGPAAIAGGGRRAVTGRQRRSAGPAPDADGDGGSAEEEAGAADADELDDAVPPLSLTGSSSNQRSTSRRSQAGVIPWTCSAPPGMNAAAAGAFSARARGGAGAAGGSLAPQHRGSLASPRLAPVRAGGAGGGATAASAVDYSDDLCLLPVEDEHSLSWLDLIVLCGSFRAPCLVGTGALANSLVGWSTGTGRFTFGVGEMLSPLIKYYDPELLSAAATAAAAGAAATAGRNAAPPATAAAAVVYDAKDVKSDVNPPARVPSPPRLVSASGAGPAPDAVPIRPAVGTPPSSPPISPHRNASIEAISSHAIGAIENPPPPPQTLYGIAGGCGACRGCTLTAKYQRIAAALSAPGLTVRPVRVCALPAAPIAQIRAAIFMLCSWTTTVPVTVIPLPRAPAPARVQSAPVLLPPGLNAGGGPVLSPIIDGAQPDGGVPPPLSNPMEPSVVRRS